MKKYLLILLSFISLAVTAQDRLFTYTYQSGVLAKSDKELEIWTTMQTGRNDYYRALSHRLEFETGLGRNIQTSFYLNYGYSRAISQVDGQDILTDQNDFSFSNEWKLKLSDPVANSFGSALYFEYSLSKDETEFEGKLILDKQLGRTVHAFNLTGEYAFEKEFETDGNEIEAETEREKMLGLNYAFAYQIFDYLSVGAEVFNKNVFEEESEIESSVLYGGPCISWSTDKFWVNFSLMPQLINFKSSKPDLTHYEKLQARLLFSFVF
jgi:hypothetical protein